MKAKIYDATKESLEISEECRSNMNMLYARVLMVLGYPTDLIQLSYRKAPSFESIARARRLIVAEYPELKGTKEVEEQRVEETGKYMSTAIYGILEG